MTLKPSPPTNLTPESQAWFDQTQADYGLDAPHEKLLLSLAAQALDRIRAANNAVAAQGAYLPDRYGGVKPHPGLATARDGATQVARLLRELALDDDRETPRPPAIQGRYGAEAQRHAG